MIRMDLPFLPPSANHAYFNLPTGGRTLSKKGKKFKREAATHLVREYPLQLRMFEANKPYGIAMSFTFTDMHNKTWPDKAKSRYKKFDTSNRVKLVEDVLAEVANTDDSQHVMLIIGKCAGTKEWTTVWAWSIEDEPGLHQNIPPLVRNEIFSV